MIVFYVYEKPLHFLGSCNSLYSLSRGHKIDSVIFE